jgi:hypothetical protein
MSESKDVDARHKAGHDAPMFASVQGWVERSEIHRNDSAVSVGYGFA